MYCIICIQYTSYTLVEIFYVNWNEHFEKQVKFQKFLIHNRRCIFTYFIEFNCLYMITAFYAERKMQLSDMNRARSIFIPVQFLFLYIVVHLVLSEKKWSYILYFFSVVEVNTLWLNKIGCDVTITMITKSSKSRSWYPHREDWKK